MNSNKTLYLVMVKGKYGYIDNNGEVIIDTKFDYAEEFNEDLAIVGVDGKLGFVNKNGKMIIEPRFKAVNIFSEDLAAVQVGYQPLL